jgi:predicted permease
MGILTLMMMFFLSLFGLVASGMLLQKYRDDSDTQSTGYKYTIFSLVFFIVAVLGTIIFGAFSMNSGSRGVVVAAAPQGAMPQAVNARGLPVAAVAPAKNIGKVTAQLI